MKRNKYKKFIDWLKKLQKERGKGASFGTDELFNFLEDNDLMIDFIECKFNWLGLYAYCKYKVEKKSLAWLKRAILQAVNPNTHNL